MTAENPRKERGAESRRGADRSTPRVQEVPKAKSKPKRVGPARMGEVAGRLEEAFGNVAANSARTVPWEALDIAAAVEVADIKEEVPTQPVSVFQVFQQILLFDLPESPRATPWRTTETFSAGTP